MSEISSALLHALNELPKVAATAHQDANPIRLGELLRRIDTLAAQLPSPADPALLHYLQRKSYDQARARIVELEAARHKHLARPADTGTSRA